MKTDKVTNRYQSAGLGDFLRRAQAQTAYSPDFALLERKQFQLMFIHDELRWGHMHDAFLKEHSVYVAPAFTRDFFSMFMVKQGHNSEVIALPYQIGLKVATREVPFCSVKGSLLLVESPQVKRLDTLKKNGYFYNRARVRLFIPYLAWFKDEGLHTKYRDETRLEFISAWMYVARKEAWDDQIDGGFKFEPCFTFEPRNRMIPTYYEFTKREYFNL